MAKIECIICFDELEEGDVFTCGDSHCYSPICGDCVSSYIEHSESDGKLPQCCNVPCKGYYLYNDIKRLSKDTLKLYESCFFKYSTTMNGNDFQKDAERLKIIKKIREKRMIFIKAEFPKAISKLASFSFTDKLRRIERGRLKMIKTKLKLARRFCMNVTCDGFLTDDLTCLTCLTRFCEKCEKPLVDGHVCKQEDIDSVNVVKNCIKCPTCNLPVVKEIGCDAMTCSNCNTRFFYSSGNIGGGGNHGQNKRISIVTKTKKLRKLFKLEQHNSLEVLLHKLEEAKPRAVKSDYWSTPLKRYYRDKNKAIAGKNLALNFDKYSRFLYESKNYNLKIKEVKKIVKEFFSKEPVAEDEMSYEELTEYQSVLEKVKNLM